MTVTAPAPAPRQRAVHLCERGSARTLCGRERRSLGPHHSSWRRCKRCKAAAEKLGGSWYAFGYFDASGWSVQHVWWTSSTLTGSSAVRWAA